MDLGSSSSSSRRLKYDVHISFRGSDTRHSFVSHLYAALKRKGINTFHDLETDIGVDIAAKILEAIEGSRISIIVFSEGYACSTWCLDELQKIMECCALNKQIVLPIFYHVDPSDVRRQGRSYSEAFAKLEEKVRYDPSKVERWRIAMKQAANLSGWHVSHCPESGVIDSVVNYVISKLGGKFSSFPAGLVGMESRVEQLIKLLNLRSNDDDVRIVGICGMNGIGKTALARVVYEMIFRNFDACCFLSNVSEVSTRHYGLSHLQEKLIRHTLELDDLKIRSDQEGTILLRTRLRGLKILLVLDDVDHFQQLEKLAGKADWFGVGSRIIITTRDAHILKRYGLGKDEIYKAELLNDDEASQLFCRKAFKCDYPEEVYEGLTSRVLEYAKGLPFAIESLASSLLKQNVSEWSGVLTKLQKIPDHWTMKVLRKSFDGLPDLEKEIFLDIACFFVGKKIDEVKEILRNYKSDPEIGIKNLIEKSLVTILDQKIRMHDLHQKMGWEIVRQESPDEPGRRSRLWLPEDLRHVNEANVATVEAIALNQDDFEGFPLRTNVFSKMIRLKLLVIRNVRFSGSLNFLPESLIYVSWYKYPFPCLPSSFKSQSLVKLLLHGGNITQLWEGMKELPNLRMMSLIDSKCLIKTPDLRGLQNLERLDLKGCTALLHIDPSITVLPNLKFLNLRNCTSLMSIPNNLFGQKSIEILNLAGCTKLAGCLDFNPLRSSLEVKVLSNQYFSMFTKLLYCIIAFVLRRLINNDSLLKDVIEDGCAAS